MTIPNTRSDPIGRDDHDLVLDSMRIDRVIAELVRNGSIELMFERDQRRIEETRELLPFGMSVYVPGLPNQPLMSKLERMCALHAAGFDPVPHLAARRITSRETLRQFLEQAVQECGVHRVLLIGGDITEANGPYVDSLAVLRDGVLARTGVREVGLAGYPEGHARIPSDVLSTALNEKLALARDQGLGSYIVTQFSFAPSRIVEYCAELAHAAPDAPVYVGMPGPTNPAKLIRFARLCGVSASLRAMIGLGFKAAKLLSHTEPNEQLAVLARYCAARTPCNVVGAHIYSFGGFFESAQWVNRIDSGANL